MDRPPKNMKGTWPQAIGSFLLPIVLILGIRWALIEPYVIPSGSMIPNLLVHDHIFVDKFSYGLRWPFSDRWLVRWGAPKRGDIIVFRYPENPEVFYVKRLIGLPGDHLRIFHNRIEVNGVDLAEQDREVFEDEDGAYLANEVQSGRRYVVRWRTDPAEPSEDALQELTIPEGQYFFSGDNRDESSDSRSWGGVPESHLIGQAWLIWLSCEEMLSSSKFVCDPATMRWDRVFKDLR